MDQGVNVVEGPDLINDHAAVGDNEACDSFSNCSETFSTYSVSSTDSEFIDDDDFLDLLRSGAAKFNITHTALQSLLAIQGVLRPHHTELPKDMRTLMKTSTNYNVVAITGGSYYQFGIKCPTVAFFNPDDDTADEGCVWQR